MTHPTRSGSPGKPSKPRPDFPLFVHGDGEHRAFYWAKKVKGRLVYFGKVADDPQGQAALALWLDQKDDLHAGRSPRVSRDGVTVAELCNRFLTAKELKRDLGQLSPHSFRDYHETCRRLIEAFGRNRRVEDLAAEDFLRLLASFKVWGPVTRGNEVNRVRVVFNWGFDSGLYERLPRYGPDFKRPNRKDLRLAKARKGLRMFEAAELRTILAAAGQPLKAMILLGINCGLGNADCGRLPLKALDLKASWLNYHREKTGIGRRCPLWPETVAALVEAIAGRPKPAESDVADRVFLTGKGASWYKDTTDNPVSKEMAKLLKKLGIDGQRNFYCLRHGFETIAGESRDQVAVNAIMGHVDSTMAGEYRERISDERLRDVSEHVRRWLFESVEVG